MSRYREIYRQSCLFSFPEVTVNFWEFVFFSLKLFILFKVAFLQSCFYWHLFLLEPCTLVCVCGGGGGGGVDCYTDDPFSI